MLLGAVILAALTVLPTWVLPGFLRSPQVGQASLSPDSVHLAKWTQTKDLNSPRGLGGTTEEVVPGWFERSELVKWELRRGRGV